MIRRFRKRLYARRSSWPRKESRKPEDKVTSATGKWGWRPLMTSEACGRSSTKLTPSSSPPVNSMALQKYLRRNDKPGLGLTLQKQKH